MKIVEYRYFLIDNGEEVTGRSTFFCNDQTENSEAEIRAEIEAFWDSASDIRVVVENERFEGYRIKK